MFRVAVKRSAGASVRSYLLSCMVVLLGCGRDKAPPSSAVESAKPADPPPVPAPVESAKPAAPPQAAAPASGCRSLPWEADGASVGEATYEGTLETLRAGVPDLNIVDDTFKLILDKPVCLPAGSEDEEKETAEIQFQSDSRTEARLRKLIGKKIAITGDGIKAFNAHHHRPIVVYAKTVTVK